MKTKMVLGISRLGLVFTLFIGACATGPQLGSYTGTCGDEFARCETHCSNLKDDRECVLRCRFQARLCERDQGTEKRFFDDAERSRVSDYTAILIDLSGKSPLASRGVIVSKQGEIASGGNYHELAPGAQLEFEIPLPNKIRQAEMALTHGPAGQGNRCFISITVEDKPVVGRYVPPKGKRQKLKWESWNLLAHLPEDRPDAPKKIRVRIQNNADKGSQESYRISGVELYFRTTN